jgi:beta-glucanase (GH16 family)
MGWKSVRIPLLLVAILVVTSACATESRLRKSCPPSDAYQLVWSDEFDGEVLDRTKWDYRGLGKRREAVNVTDTVRLDGKGNLVLTTRRAGDAIHTAMIGTQGKYETTFGYFECRVKLQTTHGHWSAFWLQSPTYGAKIGDLAAAGAEIDIYECFESRNGWLAHNVHWDGYEEHHKHAGSGRKKVEGLLDGYHTFGLEWTADEYVFYIDGGESWRTSEGVSLANEYIILSLEVGPKQAAIVREDPDFEDSVWFDYVRVFKRKPPAEPVSSGNAESSRPLNSR